MIKLVIKLAIVALVANAAWHTMVAYTSFYKFKDAVQQTTQFGSDKSIDLLPGYSQPWTFEIHTDTFSDAPTSK